MNSASSSSSPPSFLESTVQQYGSNMVMTGVQKPKKTKFLNVDTRFTNEYTYPKQQFNTMEQYLITLPERITDVKTIRVRSVEIPMSFFNFSAALGNNYFKCIDSATQVATMCVLPDGNYTNMNDLQLVVNSQLYLSDVGNLQIIASEPTDLSANPPGSFYLVNIGPHTYEVDFDVDLYGNPDKYQFRSKMGWTLGFRDPSYSVINIDEGGAKTYTNSACNLNNIRYLYLVVDEFSNSFPNSFVAPMNQYLMNKKILARVCMDYSHYPYGSLLHGNESNGIVVTDIRTYQGKIDIQKLNVQLVTEWGRPVNLNGLDFSFILEIEHE